MKGPDREGCGERANDILPPGSIQITGLQLSIYPGNRRGKEIINYNDKATVMAILLR